MKAEKFSKVDRKTKKVVGIRWRFTRYDVEQQRNVVVPHPQIPEHIRYNQNEDQVQQYVNSQSAIEDAIRYRAQQRVEWRKKYHDVGQYLDAFAEYQKERAPNSWKNDVYYLSSYAFHYFLDQGGLNNINLWNLKFEEFRVWLKVTRPLKHGKSNLSANTQQKVIKSLNRFLAFAFQKRWIDQPIVCSGYSREQTLVVTADDIFRDEERLLIYQTLKEIRPVSADFFWLLLHTGLRENEALGLCREFVFQGQMDGAASSLVHRALVRFDMGAYHGYLAVDSQPAGRLNPKSLTSVARKPLKHRRKIGRDSTRLIPIYDPQTWNILVERCELAEKTFERALQSGREDLSGRDILLFHGLTKAIFYSDLSKALKKLALRHRSPHKTRHTFLTWFYPRISCDAYLAKVVGGHQDQRDIERYNHIREEIDRETKLKAQRGSRLTRVDSNPR